MLNTKRSRVRAAAGVGMAAVVATIGAVTFNASAAEQAAVAPAAVGPDARAVSIPGIPAAIKPPKGSKPIGAYIVASGTQTYTCSAAGKYEGASTPEAQLIGTGGRVHHFGGPSWQSLRDGSKVTAKKEAESPRAGTIPELLLKVDTTTGGGVLGKSTYISRLLTSGGTAPTVPCTAGQTKAVKYGAVYVFWKN
ncbi:DUF3455 domain-containing protein [Paractinoplanes brasiliensis]|uniref:Uncharacterized protein DUF3455 n=1 Tax=Paractinoplanes brasiliensis TaxID=52695 RepID=A0A4R6JAN5_9ACTN|nr:DUF3455 domain-containing protein [Actinoplanes brasiliensis]TDO32754.1 uncharacterized protein DUF3455 [Actinoplanes brasiliensis]GID31703.1 hypothetical protein Abr02nite_66860 [Actinoplanes brasiliensis]